jgi:transposase
VESAAEQVPPTGESVAQLLARIERQAALISEGRAREAAKDAVIAALQARAEVQDAKIEALDQMVSELIAKTGRDSQNSSKPPSSDGPGTRAGRRREERERRKTEPAEGPAPGKKKRGGQAGHHGNGLAFSRTPDAKVVLEPGACRGCGGDLASGVQGAAEALQVVDIPEVRALVTEYLLIPRRCGCGTVTRRTRRGARPAPGVLRAEPDGRRAAVPCLRATRQERTAEVVNGLFGTHVSTGWTSKIAGRLAGSLHGFEDDLKTALLAEPVTLADETPASTIEDIPGGGGQAGSGRAFNPHVFTLRSADLVWLGAGHTRGHGALDTFGLFERYTGTLVSDDYNGYAKYQVRLTARQLCNAHLIRSAKGATEAEPGRQAWAAAMIEVLRAGRKSVTDAVAAGRSALAGQEIEQIRAAYREQAQAGITANLGRRTSKGDKHPSWVLAQRFHDKIDLILHHLTDFTVPWTSNLAEQALRHAKIHLKISGCFRSLETTRAYCRIHSYLITIRLNAIPPMQAIRDALAGHPGVPLRALTTA